MTYDYCYYNAGFDYPLRFSTHGCGCCSQQRELFANDPEAPPLIDAIIEQLRKELADTKALRKQVAKAKSRYLWSRTMTLQVFIRQNRTELDQYIRQICPTVGTLNDKEYSHDYRKNHTE